MIVLLAASVNYWRSTHPIPSINITRLEKLEREQTEIKADLRAALTFELDIATFFVLDELVNDTPKFNDLHLMPGRDGESLFEEATKFIRRVSTSFEGSSRGMEISSILSNASIRAEQHLRTIPPDQRPSNVDPIDLAKYKTVEFQCLILVIFLVAQKVEKKDQMISHRGNIADRVRRLSQV
jgi:hypothetical protein